MTSLLWQTVEQHCAAVLAILVSVPHGPLVHFVIKQMLEADLYDEQFQSNSCITLMNTGKMRDSVTVSLLISHQSGQKLQGVSFCCVTFYSFSKW